MTKEIELFESFVKNYDLQNENISRKYHHTYRVMELCEEIAKNLNLSKREIELATLCGLLHDIGRFDQEKKYHTFFDESSTDHGDYGYVVLTNNDYIYQFVKDESEAQIILNAVKYHNKLSFPNDLDKKSQLFLKIVRDADKIDLAASQLLENHDLEVVIKDNLLDVISNDGVCLNSECTTDTDKIIRILSWINDLNFKYSKEYFIDKKIFAKKITLLERTKEQEKLNRLKELIEERLGDNYVRNKI